MADRNPNPRPGTIGHLEEQAGIGPTHAERFAFWLPFAPLKEKAFAAAVAELERMAKARGTIRLEITGAGDPARVLTDDPALLQVLMPMRV